ncbi:ATP-dependent RNA helicase [Amycolatopsis australiensis]|uniref:ATP-dependent helicase HrpB n=1 Tax=Amycolatopsis australiensis TaxID=546364 RepID=A0A1K1T6X0_9PSEU|nr:ATP-dependent helicase C-terminal domain-containing protein [Amycolatopsis australiensis]SFW92312.1 ATP-dependent helicase HrpB [Amycolatopsis australiensis]
MKLPDLPVRAVLPDVLTALDTHGTAVLVAPPGTGKTTLVPLALADSGGRVVVAEPRRLAARAAAARMAALLGEPVGETVGYAVRGDRKVSARTRIEVVTSGLLVRRVQGDPELPGVSTVLLDECHERHLDADLLLALLLDVRAGLREDLRLLATSATVAAGRLSTLLGDAPVITATAPSYPVTFSYVPPARGERIEACVARAVRTALASGEGDVLAFLPGAGEIARTAKLLPSSDVDVLPLHGRLSAAHQDEALRPRARRRVVLATAVAESSLTVPGVRAVVDSGLARVPRVDHRRGLPGLATVRVSAAVATQRAGRAGREAPGRAYRCWAENEQALLPAYPEPEIRTAELARLALELACWSTPDGSGLAWWDPPGEGALAAGRALLATLGATDAAGTVTPRGRKMAELGLHPRLARALLDGAAEVGARNAAEVVALLDAGATLTDVEAELRRLRTAADEGSRRWKREARRLEGLVPDRESDRATESWAPDRGTSRRLEGSTPGRETIRPTEHAAPSRRGGDRPPADRAGAEPGRSGRTGSGKPDPALVVALAHPERLARRRPGTAAVYLMAGGTAAELPPGSGLDSEWLAVAEATRDPGRVHGTIRLAAAADEALARRVTPVSEVDEVTWDGDVVARRVRKLGAIVLSEKPLQDADVRDALVTGLRENGLGLLKWSADATRLRERMAFLHRVLGAPWPAVDDATLLSDVDSWLDLSRARRKADLGTIDAGAALKALLPWPEAAKLDELAPDRLEVPSGSHIRVDYRGDQPVLAVKLQETFGWTETPKLAGGRVPVLLHLLSPAGRPAAITADLAGFWTTGYPAVRADLRGRYPKHPWPEDPATAVPTRHTRRRG